MSYSAGRQRGHARESFAESFSNYDVIDPRIDVAAQKALIMMKGNPATSAVATPMLAAVKGGQLAGIFGDDLLAAAQLAAKLNTVRWQLVPRGQNAALVWLPAQAASPPAIVFRAAIRDDLQRLAQALLGAWATKLACFVTTGLPGALRFLFRGGDGPPPPNLFPSGSCGDAESTLTPEEERRLERQISLGRVFAPIASVEVELTGNSRNDIDLLTESVLCSRASFLLSGNRDPLICLVQDVTRASEVFRNLRDRSVGPLYSRVIADRLSSILSGQTADLTARNSPRYTPFLMPDPSLSVGVNPAVSVDAARDSLRNQHSFALFAMNLFAEVGADEFARVGPDAMRAVAHVVHNRMAERGQTSKQVITARRQFSWTEDSAARARALRPLQGFSPSLWRASLGVAFEAANGTMPVPAGARGATNYVNPRAAAPASFENSRCFVGSVGSHCFFFTRNNACPPDFTSGVRPDRVCGRGR